MRLKLASALILATAPAWAAGTINYGSRAGMEVTIVSMSGINGPNAVIRTKHTRDNAIAYCRDSVQRVTRKCIETELKTAISDQISANCPKKEFTNFYGQAFRFLGLNKNSDSNFPKYKLLDMQTNEIADGSSASGYPINLYLYRHLCPATAPADE